MDKDQFWQMIDAARNKAGSWQNMYDPLRDALAELTAQDIIHYKQIFDEYQSLAYKDKLWAAATLINGGCTDDGFMDFRAWLTAQGKDVFLMALENPDLLADVDTVKALGCEVLSSEFVPPNGYQNEAYFEGFLYIASYAYEKKLGNDADIYTVLEKYPLSDQEKADMASEIKYGADIDAEWWRRSDSWEGFLGEMSVFLPNLHKTFTGSEAHEVSAGIDSIDKSEGRDPAEKESVLKKIRQSKGVDTQPKPNPKKRSKDEPEH